MYEELKQQVFLANQRLVQEHLVLLTWGNVSQIDRQASVVAIKPSGVAYASMKMEDIVIVNMDGVILEGTLKPSSDLETHLVLYKRYEHIQSIVHTHSHYATVWSQMERHIPVFGTTHADSFHGSIPCTRAMTEHEIQRNYEKHTGDLIAETLTNCMLDICEMPGILVYDHGPFCWGNSADESVNNAIILEEVAHMAYDCVVLHKDNEISKDLLEKHFNRKHGIHAYYGQNT